jgi:hypothetical protein
VIERFRFLWNEWRRFWFRSSGPGLLGFGRMFFFAGLIYFFWYRFNPSFLQFNQSEAYFPVGLFRLFPRLYFTEESVVVLRHLWHILLILGLLGVRTFIVVPCTALLAYLAFAYPFNFGKVDNDTHTVMMVLIVLSFSRCGDAFSLDQLYRSWKAKSSIGLVGTKRGGCYHWPVQVIRSYILLVYLIAGLQKLRNSGFDWVFSDNMGIMIAARPSVTEWGMWLAQQEILAKIFAGVALVAQLGAFFSVFNVFWARLFVPMILFQHPVTYMLMGIDAYFFAYMVPFVFWLPFKWFRAESPSH